jgi:hypothetical protein
LLNDKAHANPDVVVQMPYRLPDAQDLVGHALKITRSQVRFFFNYRMGN